MKLIFASNNKGKIKEVQSLISGKFSIVSLQEAGITEAIEEPFHTFRENAWAKADYVSRKSGLPCMAEDSGLVVPALDGAPGVYSARYAGEPSDDTANNRKLMEAIRDMERPAAYYQSVICLLLQGQAHYFEGRCLGSLASEPRGKGGFGYDPLFIPEGYEQTFGELSSEIKNKISHRSAATAALITFLSSVDNSTAL